MGSVSSSVVHGRLSYRLSLALVVPLLVAATGGAVAFQQYRASVSALRGLADVLFAEVSSGVERQTRAFLEQAVPVSEALTEELRGGGADPLDIGSRDALVAAMLPTLRAHVDFQWLSFSTTAGSITGVYRADDGVRVWHQWIEDGQSRERQYLVGPPGTGPEAWEQVEADDESEYDPRERPFYTTAVAAGRRTWTEPYVFLPAGNPGITCATPVYGRRFRRRAARRAHGRLRPGLAQPADGRVRSRRGRQRVDRGRRRHGGCPPHRQTGGAGRGRRAVGAAPRRSDRRSLGATRLGRHRKRHSEPRALPAGRSGLVQRADAFRHR